MNAKDAAFFQMGWQKKGQLSNWFCGHWRFTKRNSTELNWNATSIWHPLPWWEHDETEDAERELRILRDGTRRLIQNLLHMQNIAPPKCVRRIKRHPRRKRRWVAGSTTTHFAPSPIPIGALRGGDGAGRWAGRVGARLPTEWVVLCGGLDLRAFTEELGANFELHNSCVTAPFPVSLASFSLWSVFGAPWHDVTSTERIWHHLWWEAAKFDPPCRMSECVSSLSLPVPRAHVAAHLVLCTICATVVPFPSRFQFIMSPASFQLVRQEQLCNSVIWEAAMFWPIVPPMCSRITIALRCYSLSSVSSLERFWNLHPDTWGSLFDHLPALWTERSWASLHQRDCASAFVTRHGSSVAQHAHQCIVFFLFFPLPLSLLQRASSAGLPPAALFVTLWSSWDHESQ